MSDIKQPRRAFLSFAVSRHWRGLRLTLATFTMHEVDIDSKKSILYISPALACISAFYLAVKLLISRRCPSQFDANHYGNALANAARRSRVLHKISSHRTFSTLSETTQDFDGVSVIFFRILRLLVIAALLAVQIFDVTSKGGHAATYLQLFVFVG